MLRGKWLEVTVSAPAGLPAELAAEALFAGGAKGLEERPARSEDRVLLVAYFDRAALPVDAAPLAVLGATVTVIRALPDRDWEADWRRGLAPIDLGSELVVVPPSAGPDAAPAPAGRKAIRIDPGSAFGSGLHPSTALVVEALEPSLRARAAEGRPRGSALDVGTGSGILAIAAWLLGARPVLAIDNDPEAVLEARRNAAFNGCGAGLEVSDRPLGAVEGRFDLVLANLDAPTLAAVGDDLAARVAPGGELIVSGLREADAWRAPAELGAPAGTVIRGGWRCERYRLP